MPDPTIDQILRANGYESAEDAILETMVGKSLRKEIGRRFRFALWPKRLSPFKGDEIGTRYTTYVEAWWEPIRINGERWWHIMATIPGSNIEIEVSKGRVR